MGRKHITTSEESEACGILLALHKFPKDTDGDRGKQDRIFAKVAKQIRKEVTAKTILSLHNEVKGAVEDIFLYRVNKVKQDAVAHYIETHKEEFCEVSDRTATPEELRKIETGILSALTHIPKKRQK